ncbi:aminotransferase class V-fold PLP-dependent enzyme [Terrimicrobium sacchariphilum]|uniref:aminotransferase class V-fold PLP-dependent enzyme n=1 Tax=Terrimicrobium sacchariphilum TaxID=690879 RepID=UPI00129A48A8|nr:aminotransferase class V-fold PLP-dependent enzyme [Terrimicrobium sacchariphilum]
MPSPAFARSLPPPKRPRVASFVIPGIPKEDIAWRLDRYGIAIRVGHHCVLPAIRRFSL